MLVRPGPVNCWQCMPPTRSLTCEVAAGLVPEEFAVSGRRLTVIDATNLQPAARSPLLEIARDHRCPAVAVAFDIDERTLLGRNETRSDRKLSEHVVKRHVSQMRSALRALGGEGFAHVVVLRSADEVDTSSVVRGH